MRGKTLLIFDDFICYRRGTHYSGDEAHLLFGLGLKKYFGRLTFLARVTTTECEASYTIPDEGVDVCHLPYYKNLTELFSKGLYFFPRIWCVLRERAHEWDVLLLCWPSPVSLLILIYTKIHLPHKSPVLLVRQNLTRLVKLRYGGLNRCAASAVVGLLELTLRLLGKDLLILAVGDEMYEQYSRRNLKTVKVMLPIIEANKLPERFVRSRREDEMPVRLLFVGRLEPEKGLDLLVRSIALIKARGTRVHLNVVGSGREEERLRDLAGILGVSPEITFHGYVPFGDPLFAHYLNADYFVLPSHSEGVPKVLMEARAFQLPLIASRVGGVPGLIQHGESGWLVEPGSAEGLCAAVCRLSNDPELTETLRSADVGQDLFMGAQLRKIVGVMLEQARRG